jgi:hypothetical protein
MGHADITITANIYTYVGKKLIEMLQELLMTAQ